MTNHPNRNRTARAALIAMADAEPAAALDRARTHIFRALNCRIGYQRADYLCRARDALNAAGFPAYAYLAESAASRIGGSDQDLERMLFALAKARGEP